MESQQARRAERKVLSRVATCLKRPVLVEFVGRPGSGKTTIAKTMSRQIQETGELKVLTNRAAYRRIYKLTRSARVHYAFLHLMLKFKFHGNSYVSRGVLSEYLRELAKAESNPRFRFARSRRLLQDLTHHIRIINKYQTGVHFMSEGMAQCAATGMLSGVSHAVLERHLSLMPASDIYVHVNTRDDVIRERLLQRDGSLKNNIPVDVFENIEAELEAREYNLINVSGEGDPDSLAREARASISDCLKEDCLTSNQ